MTRDELLELLARAKAEGWKELDLAGMEIEELPPEIGELTELEVLILGKWDGRRRRYVGNNLTRLPLELCELAKLTSLDLTWNQIESLPPEIGLLSQLVFLDLSANRLTSLPEGIGKLESLTFLDIRSNKLETLPESFNNLKNLTNLDANFNYIKKLPDKFGDLISLSMLELSGNNLSFLPESFSQLSQLISVDLSGNCLSLLPMNFGNLENLLILNLRRNSISNLPSSTAKLKKLKSINLSGNLLTQIPNEVCELSSVEELNLGNNKIRDIQDSISRLTFVKKINLEHNNISKIPNSLRDLKRLKELDLNSNQIYEIPKFLQSWNFGNINLRANPLPVPPEIFNIEISQKEITSAILDFYFDTQYKSKQLYESKLLIVGDPSAGKTTLANKLQNPDYQLQPEEKSTEGIDLIPWEIDHPSGNPLRTNIWDFGGQQIYHSTHQFFLTERSVYLLVADTRKENTDFYYWLRVIETLSNGSPVIIVKNEKQNRQCDLDERSLRAEFLNLREILAVNLATDRGLEALQTTLQTYLCNLPHIGSKIPKPWANIRAVLENISQNQNFITRDRYFELCRNNGFDDEKDMLAASKFLHDLGICLHFQNVRGLRKLLILKPTWATGSIYKILDNKRIKANFGRFSDDDLETIWDNGDDAKMRDELLDLMMHFGLCYEIPNRCGHYISPQLLEKESLDYTWDDRDNLILRYEYTFKPKDIFPRFVVATHELIENQALVWRHGVVLTDGYARAEILEEDRYHKAEITIRVSGSSKRDLLSYVARELEKISNTYDRIQYQTYIPCNCDTCKTSTDPYAYTWENLRRRLQNKRYDVECELSYAKVNVQSLLDDIAVPQAMSRDGEMDRLLDPTGRSSPFNPQIHINYQQPQQTMTQNTGRTINTGGGDYREINNTGANAQYAEGNIINHQNTTKTPAESAQEIQDLLKQLDLTPDLADRRINTRIARQDLDWQKRLWSALANAAPELLKSGAALVLAPLGFSGAAAAATLNVIVEATRGALEDEGAIAPDEPDPIDMARLMDL